jgi:FdhD protein
MRTDDTEEGTGGPVLRFDGCRLTALRHNPVAEVPLALTVNGKELATLIASPHDLHFLVAGFLRMQGLVEQAGDILSLGICEASRAADVRIRKAVPERLLPILTSGCGAGIAFRLPVSPGRPVGGPSGARGGLPGAPPPPGAEAAAPFASGAVFAMMDALVRLAEGYRKSGGIHSSAAGDGTRILLYAEDIGRHNTLDRIAGEALLREIDLAGTLLVTSGRVSSEMAAKGAALGVALIASRTSPTDLAVRICNEAGITLIGYVRGRRFDVYTHPRRISFPRGKEE